MLSPSGIRAGRPCTSFRAGAVPILADQTAQLAAQTRPVDPLAVAPYLGPYSDGFHLRRDDAGVLRLDHDIRSMPLLALADGGYIVTNGPSIIAKQAVTFTTDDNGLPVMEIAGFAPVRWLTGA